MELLQIRRVESLFIGLLLLVSFASAQCPYYCMYESDIGQCFDEIDTSSLGLQDRLLLWNKCVHENYVYDGIGMPVPVGWDSIVGASINQSGGGWCGDFARTFAKYGDSLFSSEPVCFASLSIGYADNRNADGHVLNVIDIAGTMFFTDPLFGYVIGMPVPQVLEKIWLMQTDSIPVTYLGQGIYIGDHNCIDLTYPTYGPGSVSHLADSGYIWRGRRPFGWYCQNRPLGELSGITAANDTIWGYNSPQYLQGDTTSALNLLWHIKESYGQWGSCVGDIYSRIDSIRNVVRSMSGPILHTNGEIRKAHGSRRKYFTPGDSQVIIK